MPCTSPELENDLNKIQEVFNRWQDESGIPYSHISRIAACSIGSNIEPNHLQSEISKFEKKQGKTRGR